MGTEAVQTKTQIPGLRIPPTTGCRSLERPEVVPAHTCKRAIGSPARGCQAPAGGTQAALTDIQDQSGAAS